MIKKIAYIVCICIILRAISIYIRTESNTIQHLSDILPTSRNRINIVQDLPVCVELSLTIPDRDLNKLTPETKQLAEQFLIATKKAGYHLFVTEGLRSKERQQALYAQGRTQPGKVVTRTMNSRHLKGLAFDVAFLPAHHGTAYPDDLALREGIGQIGESLGLVRGGRWRRPDRPHFQNGR